MPPFSACRRSPRPGTTWPSRCTRSATPTRSPPSTRRCSSIPTTPTRPTTAPRSSPSGLQLDVGDPRIRREATDRVAAEVEVLEHRLGLAREALAVELVEGDDRALAHPRQEQVQRGARRLVEVEVEVEQ